MKYILKNIKSFAKDYTKIFVLLVVTIATSTLIIHLSYGLFREYRERKEIRRYTTNEVVLKLHGSHRLKPASVENDKVIQMFQTQALENKTYEKFSDNADVTVSDLKRFAEGLEAEVADKLLNVHTGILLGDYRFETDFLIASGKPVNSAEYGFDSLYNFSYGGVTSNTFQAGRYFTDEEYEKGSKVCIMYGFGKEAEGEYLKEYLVDSSHALLGGEKYEIIGLQNGIGTGYVPVTSVEGDSVLLDGITFRFKDNVSMREIGILNKTAEKYFGERAESLFELEESEEDSYLYNTILLLILVVSLVAAFNFCALYHYIMTTRERTLRIFRICGLGLWKSIGLYIGECSLLSTGTYLITLGIFRFVLMPLLAGYMDIFDFHFKAEVYVVLFGIYFISSFFMQFLVIVTNLKRKTLRGGG